MSSTAPAAAQSLDSRPLESGVWSPLRDNDLAVATALYRLSVANTDLCTDKAPETGMVLISPDEFPAAIRPDFRAAYREAAPMIVEAVVPGSPADLAGVKPGSGLVAIGDMTLPKSTPDGRESMAQQIAARHIIERLAPDQPVVLELRESGLMANRTIRPRTACRATAELLTDNAMTAQSDDTSIQLSATFLFKFSKNALPVLMAHELAHVILHHGQKLDAQHVHRGLLSPFGRNATLIRGTEDEADRMSVHLLANAGYDPQLAVTFWMTEGRRMYPIILASPTHGSPTERVRMIQAEITQMACHIGGCDRGDGAFALAAVHPQP